jgi:hypothetical protein
MLSYLQESFKKLLFSGSWTYRGTAPAPVTTARTRQIIPIIEVLVPAWFKIF